MFDLPTKTKNDKKSYIDFRRFLLNDGFDMMQYSIYSRLCPSNDIAEKHTKRIVTNTPKKGSIRMMTITNKQYADMKILAGKKTTNERRITSENLTIF